MARFSDRTIASCWLPDTHHPLYAMERRHIKWAAHPDHARRKAHRAFAIPFMTIPGLWFFALLSDALRDPYIYNDWNTFVLGASFIFSMTVMTFILDISAIIVTFGSINNEHVLKRWDLIVLASEKDALIASKHAIARLKVQRLLLFNQGVRAGVLLTFLLWSSFSGYVLDNGFPTIVSIINDLSDFPLQALNVLTMVIFAMIYYIMEPLWRVRAITALGVAASAYMRRIGLLAPVAFALLVFVWTAQAGTLWLTSVALIGITNFLSNFIILPDTMNLFGYLYILLILCAYLLIVSYLYRTMTKQAYRRIAKRIP